MEEKTYEHEFRHSGKDNPTDEEQLELTREYQALTARIKLLAGSNSLATWMPVRVVLNGKIDALYRKRGIPGSKLIIANTPAVWRLAQKKYGRLPWVFEGNKLEDIVSSCKIEMLKGLDTFDPERGTLLRRYFNQVMDNQMKHYIAQESPRPKQELHSLYQAAYYVRQVWLQWRQDLKREVSLDEFVKLEGVLSKKQIEYLLGLKIKHSYLDSPINGEKGVCLGDITPDEKNLSPLQEAEINSQRDQLPKLFQNLPSRAAWVFNLRYGRTESYKQSVDEIFRDHSKEIGGKIAEVEKILISNGGDPRSIRKLKEYAERLPGPDTPLPELN